MVKDAEKNATEDKKRREEIDTRNRLDSMTYEVEKNSKEWSDRLAGDHKSKLEAAVERARKALRGDDMNEIRAAQEELTRVYGEAGSSLYAQNQQSSTPGGDAGAQGGPQGGGPAGGPTAGSTAGKPDDAVEADYEIVDDKK
jgi:molecular chaperone DnaK